MDQQQLSQFNLDELVIRYLRAVSRHLATIHGRPARCIDLAALNQRSVLNDQLADMLTNSGEFTLFEMSRMHRYMNTLQQRQSK